MGFRVCLRGFCSVIATILQAILQKCLECKALQTKPKGGMTEMIYNKFSTAEGSSSPYNEQRVYKTRIATTTRT